jgi:23S rRNA (guanosine2251-2'-O)-methyltransferase
MQLLLNDVRSALNIGSIFRSSDAFAVEKIWLTGICACPPNKEILKTALGATQTVEWEYIENPMMVIEQSRKNGFAICAIEQCEQATLLQNFEAIDTDKTLLILGNEVEGVAKSILDVCDTHIEIPQFGEKKSLNVAVTTGIVLWHLTFQKLQVEK